MGDKLELQSETQNYEELTFEDRKWICFALDMSQESMLNFDYWSREFSMPTAAAAHDVLFKCVALHHSSKIDPSLNFDTSLYPPLISTGVFTLRFGRCQTEASFRFLFERLFGGAVRPYIASVFGACALHPDVSGVPSSELELALFERDMGLGTDDVVFWPVWNFEASRPK